MCDHTIPLDFIAAVGKGEGIGLSVTAISAVTQDGFHPTNQASLETYNLVCGWKHLQGIISSCQNASNTYFSDFAGLLEVEEVILDLHKIVMNDLTPKAGQLTTSRRLTSFNGQAFEYPRFLSSDILHDGLLYLTDRLNIALQSLKTIPSNSAQLDMLLYHVSKFLFAFLTLHPFADGNGRTARLLAAYIMRAFLPTWTTFEPSHAFVSALVSLRQNLALPLLVTTREDMFTLVNDLLCTDVQELKDLIHRSVKLTTAVSAGCATPQQQQQQTF